MVINSFLFGPTICIEAGYALNSIAYQFIMLNAKSPVRTKGMGGSHVGLSNTFQIVVSNIIVYLPFAASVI